MHGLVQAFSLRYFLFKNRFSTLLLQDVSGAKNIYSYSIVFSARNELELEEKNVYGLSTTVLTNNLFKALLYHKSQVTSFQ